MEQQGLTRRDLEAMLGTRARVAEILNRKRDLSIGMISKIARAAGHFRGRVDPPCSQDSRSKPSPASHVHLGSFQARAIALLLWAYNLRRSSGAFRMKLLGLQMCVTTQHLPISVAGDQGHLFDREAGLEKAARAFVPQIMKM